MQGSKNELPVDLNTIQKINWQGLHEDIRKLHERNLEWTSHDKTDVVASSTFDETFQAEMRQDIANVLLRLAALESSMDLSAVLDAVQSIDLDALFVEIQKLYQKNSERCMSTLDQIGIKFDEFKKLYLKDSDRCMSTLDQIGIKFDEFHHKIIADVAVCRLEDTTDKATDQAKVLDAIKEVNGRISESQCNVLDAVREVDGKIVTGEYVEARLAQPLLEEFGKINVFCEKTHDWLKHMSNSMKQWGLEHVRADMMDVAKWLECVHKALEALQDSAAKEHSR